MSHLFRITLAVVLSAAVGSSTLLDAQSPREGYDKKLSQPFAKKIPWKMELAEAMAEAKAGSKLIFAYFTRARYCLSSRVYERGDLVSDWWVDISKEFVPYLNLVGPVEGAPDRGMMKKIGGKGFPYMVFMSADGKVLCRVRPRSEWHVRGSMDVAKWTIALRARLRKDAGDEKAKRSLALLKALEKVYAEEISNEAELEAFDRLAARPGIDRGIAERYREQRVRLLARINVRKFTDVLRRTDRRRHGKRQAVLPERDTAVYALYREGVTVPLNGFLAVEFYAFVVNGAAEANDLPVAREAHAYLLRASRAREFHESKRKFLDAATEKLAEAVARAR